MKREPLFSDNKGLGVWFKTSSLPRQALHPPFIFYLSFPFRSDAVEFVPWNDYEHLLQPCTHLPVCGHSASTIAEGNNPALLRSYASIPHRWGMPVPRNRP